MNAVALQIPGHEMDERVIARDQPEYIPLPVLDIVIGTVPALLTRWRPSDEERAAIAKGADIWLETMTFGEPMQPVRITTECPLDNVAVQG